MKMEMSAKNSKMSKLIKILINIEWRKLYKTFSNYPRYQTCISMNVSLKFLLCDMNIGIVL